MWQVFNTKYRDEQMIEVHVNKQTHVLGAQGVLHSLLFGALTGTSTHMQKKEKTEMKYSLINLGRYLVHPPPKHSYG